MGQFLSFCCPYCFLGLYVHLTGYDLVINDRTPCSHISVEECRSVAEKLGLDFEFKDDTDHPPNCSLEADYLDVYFNNKSSSTQDCDYLYQCFCNRV